METYITILRGLNGKISGCQGKQKVSWLKITRNVNEEVATHRTSAGLKLPQQGVATHWYKADSKLKKFDTLDSCHLSSSVALVETTILSNSRVI